MIESKKEINFPEHSGSVLTYRGDMSNTIEYIDPSIPEMTFGGIKYDSTSDPNTGGLESGPGVAESPGPSFEFLESLSSMPSSVKKEVLIEPEKFYKLRVVGMYSDEEKYVRGADLTYSQVEIVCARMIDSAIKECKFPF